MKRRKEWARKAAKWISDPRSALCFAAAWMVTNGWAYAALAVGGAAGLKGLASVAGAYLALLWLPCTPEKILTVALAVWLRKALFPDGRRKERSKTLSSE